MKKLEVVASYVCLITYSLLHSNFGNQGLRHYPFMVNLDRYYGSCNTLHHSSDRASVPNKTENVNINVFNMITRLNE